ncbi:nucleotidyltransferase [Limosilactobacillus mucosae]|uniref:nucleotidyltransferase n=1 Tax=Limosilactobacillus mucosae TaxID=97478 RepID=UPI00088AE0AE|nr:nucleotidyltransferase [Limosilactobacillus mucosae]SDN35700.1 Predicted nucleotidyltransferase [Limosilactobacillus mucosae]SEK83798.1 Predicted nucleotidyltransferase [Limosilactobacillus mucosae]SFK11089.1 Predicted nucleotidyltransferase [Limosilactobacillus mucosae]
MHAVGLVTEYNPFHNGHRYHLSQARELTHAEVVVAVMSGNFTQRGEPTLLDKWQRAQAALTNGVDLVIELPIFMAVQPAHRFAAGALELLAALGVDDVVFGAEHPKWDFKQLVAAEQNFTASGFSQYNATFATQFNEQLKDQTGLSLTDPNDILSFGYYKAQINERLPFRLHPIQRRGSQYHDERIEGKIASASAIRQAVLEHGDFKQAVPVQTAQQLQKLQQVPSWDAMYPMLRNQLIQAPVEQLAQIYQMAEGLEYRMKDAAQRNLSFAGFMKAVKTKRYTYAHLLRVYLYTILQLTESQVSDHLKRPYLHVLGFNERGRDYLHSIKKQVELPLLTKIDQNLRDDLLNLDYRAGKLYQTFTPVEQDLKHAPVIVKGVKE